MAWPESSDKNSLLGWVEYIIKGIVCKGEKALMITDSNQVCFVKMSGRRVQEVLYIVGKTCQ
jgi:hypothetical protein